MNTRASGSDEPEDGRMTFSCQHRILMITAELIIAEAYSRVFCVTLVLLPGSCGFNETVILLIVQNS
jgi:hypothetical protein